jgi:hypothetical protein
MSALSGLAELSSLGRHRKTPWLHEQDRLTRAARRQAMITYWTSPQSVIDERLRCLDQGRMWDSAGFRCI